MSIQSYLLFLPPAKCVLLIYLEQLLTTSLAILRGGFGLSMIIHVIKTFPQFQMPIFILHAKMAN